jgi:hypothetical protein
MRGKQENFSLLIMGIGDWGLGIGDWAQSPIPNPQSPIPKRKLNKFENKIFCLWNLKK